MRFTKLHTDARVQVGLLLTIWWSAAALTTVQIKLLLNGVYSCPFALTGHADVICAAMMWTILGLRALRKRKMHWLSNEAFGFVAIVGTCQGIEYGLVNQALHDVTLSSRTMIMSTSALYTFITAQCWGLPPKFSLARCGCMLILMAGGICEAWGSPADTQGNPLRGLLCLVSSLTLSAQRWAYVQRIFQQSGSPVAEYTKLEISARVLLFAAIPCYIASAFLETRPSFSGEAFQMIMIASMGILIITCSELKLVHLTSSTTFVIFALLHNIPLVICGVFFFHDDVHAFQLFGFAITILGSILYSMVTDITHPTDGDQEVDVLLGLETGQIPHPSAPPLEESDDETTPTPTAPPAETVVIYRNRNEVVEPGKKNTE
eukprot:GEMP01021170.1.p1 GENE.GEMP01021170.1~~GEMP01021170.1.p1  ORF type:complete len:376 (+),score=52.79 GEMP01021170.1:84-1211(+)